MSRNKKAFLSDAEEYADNELKSAFRKEKLKNPSHAEKLLREN